MNTAGNFFKSPSFKFIVIGILSLLLLIPAAMIRGLINEREARNFEATSEISQSWSLSQTLTGPFLSVPYRTRDVYHLLPEVLDVNGTIFPMEKKRGIFNVAVYNSELKINGYFDLTNEGLSSLQEKYSPRDKVYLGFGISDMRGIGNLTEVLINGQNYDIEPGLYNQDITLKGFSIALDPSILEEKPRIDFNITLELKGSSEFFITPLGKRSDVYLRSTWPDPSFTGEFLPKEKNISNDGFDATWAVNYMNRNYPQGWMDEEYDVRGSTFGVKFLIPVDHYQKSERSVKYAFMFIALSFLVFFLTEIIMKSRIHPIQYLLVGFALIVFYTLLISLSEHIGFNLAYLISTLAITILVGSYMRSSTASVKVGFISSILLLFLYGFLFTTLQLQELSLLIGSIGLFIILAIIMIVSRKINWYKEE